MNKALKDKVFCQLKAFMSPDGSTDIVAAGLVSDIFITSSKIYIPITIVAAKEDFFVTLRQDIEHAVKKIAPDHVINITLTHTRSPKVKEVNTGKPSAPAPLDGVKYVIAVASGKGGVGKSTVAFNLALALHNQGLKVGLLDADIYGPSVPLLSGKSTKPEVTEDKKLIPLEAFGIKLMSIGFLINSDEAAIWRGPMVMGAVKQMLQQVAWSPLDILVVDMPPGTGDAQLTLIQQVKVAGAVIVSTPQEMALIDARRAINMFNKVDVNILGLVENMSYFVAPDTGKSYDILGRGGAARMANDYNVDLLAEIPISMELRASADDSCPLLPDNNKDKLITGLFKEVAEKIIVKLSQSKEL